MSDRKLYMLPKMEEELARAYLHDATDPHTVIDPTTLDGADVPAQEWIIPDWAPKGCVTSDIADGGVGKSLLAQQAMTALATGTDFLGIKVNQCSVFGLFCEDPEHEIHRRQVRINTRAELSFKQLGAMRWVSGVAKDNLLATFDKHGLIQPTDKYQWLCAETQRLGAQLVVLDTLADLYGGNENDRFQVRQFIGLLTKLAVQIDGAVLLNGHPSRDGLKTGNIDGGSTAWSNSVRSRWSLARPAGDDVPIDTPERVLVRRKSNYAKAGEQLKLTWRDGVFVRHGSANPFTAVTERLAIETVFLAILDRLTEAGVPLSMVLNAGNYAPRVMAKQHDAGGATKQDFERAMRALIGSGAIINETYGRKSDERRRIARRPLSDAADTGEAA